MNHSYVVGVRELWTIHQVAQHWGVSVSRAQAILAQHSVKSGYDHEQVKAIPRPGQGARTDLKKEPMNNTENQQSSGRTCTRNDSCSTKVHDDDCQAGIRLREIAGYDDPPARWEVSHGFDS